MKFTSALVAFGAVCATLVVAQPAFAGKANDTLTVAMARGIATTDGLYSTSRANDILGLLVDDALFYVDPDLKKPVPLVAKSYEFTDPTTLVIQLRDDVTFHDGSPLTAKDVAYSFNYIVSDEGETKYAGTNSEWMQSVAATGPLEVTFKLKAPNAMALYYLSYYSKIRKQGSYEVDGAIDPDAQQTLTLGSGPYKVTEFTPGERVVLERYAGYRSDSPKKPTINKIVIRAIPDEATIAAEVMSGGVDWTYDVSAELAENVAKSGRVQYSSTPSMRVGYLSLDAAGRSDPDTPLKDVRVRQALNYAINHEELVENVTGGDAKVAWTPCQSQQLGCDQDVPHYDYNPEKAKALLTEAGYADGITLDLWASRDRPLQEAIIAYWEKVGVHASLHYMKSISKDRNAGKLGVYYDTWGSYSIPDAGAILPDLFDTSVAKVYTGDDELGAFVKSGNATYDNDERAEIFSKVVHEIVDKAYWVPVQEYALDELYSNDLDYTQPQDGMQRLFMAHWK